MVDIKPISYSRYTSLLQCPKRYYLQRIARVEEVPAHYLSAGKALHTVIEQIERQWFEESLPPARRRSPIKEGQ